MNKNQYERYRKIHDRISLRSSYGATLSELMNLCNIQERQLKKDLAYMRDAFEAPIEYDRKLKAYVYFKKFELPTNLYLSREELNQLKVALQTLSQFKHLEAYKDFEGIFYKIEQSFKNKYNYNSPVPIYFEKVPHYKGTEHIDLFLEAIENTQNIEFQYQTFSATKSLTHIFQPYFIKEHSNRWYVIGYLPKEKSITTFALDRIINEPILQSKFYDIPSGFDVNEHYEFTYGIAVYMDKQIETVVLEFTPKQARFFKSKPFHPFEIIQEDENKLRVEMQLRPNFELVRKLVSFGKGVKVIQPESLKNDIIKYFSDALNQY